MTFNTNRAFKWLIFEWMDYDGENFKKSDFIGSILPYLWFRFWWIASIYNIARYCTLAGLSADKLPVLEFYLGDWCSIIKGLSHRFIILVGAAFSVWLLTTACLFQRLMGEDRRYRYWLRFFQIPATRSAPRLAGYSKEKLKKFWQFSSSLQSLLLKSMAIQSALLASCFAASYVVEMQRYSNLHSPPIFWTILMLNSIYFVMISTQTLLSTHGPILYLFLTCQILEKRLVRTTQRLKHFSSDSRFDRFKIDRYLADFGSIVDDIHRCDFFFSKYLTLNYHIAVFILLLVLLCALNSEDVILTISTAVLFVMTYSTLVICFFVCGNLHSTIRSAYPPLTRLMANKHLKLSANLRIVRLLDFINSEYAGFRCSTLFLVRKYITAEICFAVLINTMLLSNMIFFIFNAR